MRKFVALVVARTKEFYRDKFTLMWTFLFPFLVMVGFAYGVSGHQEPLLKIGVTPASAVSVSALKELQSTPGVQLIGYEDKDRALGRLQHHQLDLFVTLDPARGAAGRASALTYWVNSDAPNAGLAERILKTSVPAGTPVIREQITGQKIRYVDWLVPGLVGMNLMFGSLYGVGYVIVRYRKNGVLKRLRATPLSAFEFLLAQVVARTLILFVTTSITVLGARVLVGFHMLGSWLDLAVFISVGCTSLIALGMLIAARVTSEEMADGVLNIMSWPMMFLSGVWFSLEGASHWVESLARILPLTHVVNGLRAIMLDGAPLAAVMPELVGLAIAGAVLLVIGSLLFKWS